MATWNKVYMSSNRWVYFALFLFLVIILSTFWLYYQNSNIFKERTNELTKSIKTQEEYLAKLKKDDILQVFSLLKTNMWSFKQKEKTSNIPVLINKIEKIGRDYDIVLKSFSYSDWKINLKAEARQREDETFNPSVKVAKFVWDFRTKVESETNNDWKIKEKIIKAKIKDFDLDFIKTFSWESKIDFDMILKINIKEYLKENKSKKIKNIKKVNNKKNLEEIKKRIEELKRKKEQEENKKVDEEEKNEVKQKKDIDENVKRVEEKNKKPEIKQEKIKTKNEEKSENENINEEKKEINKN